MRFQRNRHIIPVIAALLLMIMGWSSRSTAGGFQVNLQGHHQLGMGHTGTGLALGPGNLFFNPGGLAFTKRSLSVDGFAIYPLVQYRALAPSDYTASPISDISTPFAAYGTYRSDSSQPWMVGLGVYTPFGSTLEWPEHWQGQFLIQEIGLQTVFLQPTFSYQLSERLGIGLGPVYALGKFSLNKKIPLQQQDGSYSEAQLQGQAQGWGANIGVYYQATPDFSIGIDYQSPVKMVLRNGNATFDIPSSLENFFPNTTFSTSITLPHTLSIGAGYRLNDHLSFSADINFVGWSAYDTLALNFEDNTDKLTDTKVPKTFQNTRIYRVGAAFQPNEKWHFRGGAYYDESPVLPHRISPQTPDGDKLGLTVGLGYRPVEHLQFNASFLFIESWPAKGYNPVTGFGGTFKSRAFIGGIGIRYQY